MALGWIHFPGVERPPTALAAGADDEPGLSAIPRQGAFDREHPILAPICALNLDAFSPI
jgi:hypothetical protein